MWELHSEDFHQQILRAREEERKEVARELHDQIIQALVGLTYHLSNMDVLPDSGMHHRLAQTQDDLRRILNDVRRICTDLRSPTATSPGLLTAIESHIHELIAQDLFVVDFQVEGDPSEALSTTIELCLFRVFQEALTNVRKHAAAQRVTVRLGVFPQEVLLSVSDDGKGFNVPLCLEQLLDDQHLGLIGMHERLNLVCGVLQVISNPGQGTYIQAQIPRKRHGT
jgi:signal transduction histidine kinase